MSHNIFRAIFSYPRRSDTLCIANKENMCRLYKTIMSLEFAKNKWGVMAQSVLSAMQPVELIYGW